MIIADTEKEARELAEEHIMVSYRREYAGGWKHPFIDAVDRHRPRHGQEGPLPHRQSRPGASGDLKPFVEQYGMTHLICRLFFPGMPHRHIMRELELISKEVMPAFK